MPLKTTTKLTFFSSYLRMVFIALWLLLLSAYSMFSRISVWPIWWLCGTVVCTVSSQQEGLPGWSFCIAFACPHCVRKVQKKKGQEAIWELWVVHMRVRVNMNRCMSSCLALPGTGNLSMVWPCLYLIDLYDPECRRKQVWKMDGWMMSVCRGFEFNVVCVVVVSIEVVLTSTQWEILCCVSVHEAHRYCTTKSLVSFKFTCEHFHVKLRN